MEDPRTAIRRLSEVTEDGVISPSYIANVIGAVDDARRQDRLDLEEKINDEGGSLPPDTLERIDAIGQTAADAQATANQSLNDSATARQTAQEAASTASSAYTTAANAAATAEEAKGIAEAIQATGGKLDAESTAIIEKLDGDTKTAKNTADLAKSTADTAKSTADTAKTTADSALESATSAMAKAEANEAAITALQSAQGPVIWSGTQEEYEASDKDPDTLYLIFD